MSRPAVQLRLREYQQECITAVWSSWAGQSGLQRPAVVLPTGAGKTVIFSHLSRDYTDVHRRIGDPWRVVILVHRDELADQTIAKVRAVAPDLTVGKVKADDDEVHADVMVCSVQTLARQTRLDRLVRAQRTYGNVGLVIVDECHHAAAPSYQTILRALGCFDRVPSQRLDGDHWEGTRAVGFTATLKRGDDVGLGDTWQDVVYTRPLLWMIAKGYLTDARGVTVNTSVDLGTVKKSGGDYQAKDLGKALMEHQVPQQTAQVIEEYAARRRPIVFMPDVATAHATVDALERRGISAAAVDGTTPRETRLGIYEQFRRGRTRVLVNCMVLTEGADFPWADCVVVARPTRNEALYIQMVGRGLRPWDGKDDCLVINMAGAGGRLCTLIDLEPGAVDEVREGETLADAAVRHAEEQDAVAFNSDNPAFLLKHRDVDLFTASKHAWLRTDGGVMFVPFAGRYMPESDSDAAGNGYVLLWPEGGTWTVAMAPERGRWHRLHTGLTLGMAQAWAETEAEERNSFNGQKKASWRRDKPSPPQQRFARGLGIKVDGLNRGELSDEISRVQATRLLDRFMRSQEAS